MARASSRTKYLATIRALRVNAPTVYPVSVRRADPGDGCLASCELVKAGKARHFVIRIRPEASLQEQVSSLIHEWSHCLAWTEGHPTLEDHDPVWGACYSKCYTAVFPDAPNS